MRGADILRHRRLPQIFRAPRIRSALLLRRRRSAHVPYTNAGRVRPLLRLRSIATNVVVTATIPGGRDSGCNAGPIRRPAPGG